MSKNVGAVAFKGADGSLDRGDVLSAVLTAKPLFSSRFPPNSLLISSEQTEQHRHHSQPGQRGFEE